MENNGIFMTIIGGIGGFFGITLFKHEREITKLQTEMCEVIKTHDTIKETNILIKRIADKMKIKRE